MSINNEKDNVPPKSFKEKKTFPKKIMIEVDENDPCLQSKIKTKQKFPSTPGSDPRYR